MSILGRVRVRHVARLVIVCGAFAAAAHADDKKGVPEICRSFAKTQHTTLVRALGFDKPMSDMLRRFAVSPDGKLLCVGADLIDLGTQKVVRTLKTSSEMSLEDQAVGSILKGEDFRMFTADGKRLILAPGRRFGGHCPIAFAYDLKTGKDQRLLSDAPDAGGGLDVAFIPSTAVAVVGCTTGSVWLWATDGSKPARNLAPDPNYAKNYLKHWSVTAVDVSPDGKRALTVAGPEITLWDLKTGKIARMLQESPRKPEAPDDHPPFVFRAIFTADGKQAISVDASGSVTRWNVETGAPTTVQASVLPATDALFEGIPPCVFSHDRRTLAYWKSHEYDVYLYDVDSGSQIDRIDMKALNTMSSEIFFGERPKPLHRHIRHGEDPRVRAQGSSPVARRSFNRRRFNRRRARGRACRP
jgi:WD40 repeat protein